MISVLCSNRLQQTHTNIIYMKTQARPHQGGFNKVHPAPLLRKLNPSPDWVPKLALKQAENRQRWHIANLKKPTHRCTSTPYKDSDAWNGRKWKSLFCGSWYLMCLEWQGEVMMEWCERTGDEEHVRKCCLSAATACSRLQSHYNTKAICVHIIHVCMCVSHWSLT